MKKFILLVFVGVMFISSEGFANETVTLAIGEWPPYTSENDPNGKIAEVIVTEAFKLENIDVVFEYYPWKRSYETAKNGAVEGTFPWFVSEERSNDFIFHKEPLIKESEVFFHLKNVDFHWEQFEDLTQYNLGGTIGYLHVDVLKQHGIAVDLAAEEESNFKKLLVGRIDAYPTSFLVGYDVIHQMFAPERAVLFTNHPKPLHENEMFLIISRNISQGQELADTFDQGLKKLKASGRYDEIIAEFLERK